MLLFLPAAAADTCWLATIASRDRAFSVPLAAEALPVGSLVRVGSGACDAGVPVEVPLGDVFFNDPAVIAAVPGVRPLKGHDDHIHMCFAG